MSCHRCRGQPDTNIVGTDIGFLVAIRWSFKALMRYPCPFGFTRNIDCGSWLQGFCHLRSVSTPCPTSGRSNRVSRTSRGCKHLQAVES